MKEEKKKRHKEEDGNLSLVKKKRSDDSPNSTPHSHSGGVGGSSCSSSKGGRGGACTGIAGVGSSSSGGPNLSGNSSYVPMSERQQFALIKQMETEEGGSGSLRSGVSGEHMQHAFDKKLNKRNYTGETMLIQMAKKGDLASIKSLVQEGANINEQDYAGWTALHESCIRNYPRVTRYLLRHGASVHLRGLHGDTALHDATRNGSLKVIHALLKYEADPYAANDKGERPVDLSPNEEIQRLLRGGAREESNSSESSISDSDHSDQMDNQRSDEAINAESGIRSPIRSCPENYKRLASGTSEVTTGRVKDPYAFEDDESEYPNRMEDTSSPTMTSPIKLRLTKEGQQYTLLDPPDKEDSSSEHPDNPPSTADDLGNPVGASGGGWNGSNEPSGGAPKLEPMIKTEDEEELEEMGDETEDDDVSSMTSRKEGDHPSGGGERDREQQKVESGGDVGVEGGYKDNHSDDGSANEESDVLPKVPPLRIKLSTPAEGSSTPGQGSSGASGGGNGATSGGGQGEESSGLQPSCSSPQQLEKDGGRDSDTKTGSGEELQQSILPQQTTQRGYRSGRTLRSHTAAQREKEEKERVDVAPIKKRKLRSRHEAHGDQSSRGQDGGGGVGGGAGSGGGLPSGQTMEGVPFRERSYKAELPENPFDKAALLNRQRNEMLNRLVNIQPKAPNGYQDYLMVTRDYLQASKINSSFKKRNVPNDLADKRELVELFNDQEEERFTQALKHQSEREHLRLCAEQEVIRSQTRASLALSGQSRPFSFCSVVSYKDYTYLPPIDQHHKEEESVRDRFTPRTFKGWINDTKDKFEKEKNKLLCRQLHESESLMMVQKLDWEMKLKELLIHDFRAEIFKTISTEHVPHITVPYDFPLFPQDPV